MKKIGMKRIGMKRIRNEIEYTDWSTLSEVHLMEYIE